MSTAVFWFRRDLRLSDNPALSAALSRHDEVVPCFIHDDELVRPAGRPRLNFLYDCLRSLNHDLGGALVVRHGDPVRRIPTLVREVDASAGYVAEDFMPYGRRRDGDVESALNGVPLERIGSPYAVDPGTVRKKDDTPYLVFTPFYRAWKDVGWDKPRSAGRTPSFVSGLDTQAIPENKPDEMLLPEAGEKAAHQRLDAFLDNDVLDYDATRDQPGIDGTSRLSPYLKYGCIHPRQILERLGRTAGEETYRSELAWREFYADVVFHNPDSVRKSLNPKMTKMKLDTGKGADKKFDAWATGQTGYPIVDAGMRQLHAEGWVHNRVRMIVASFLVKDLHIDWLRGARFFLEHLVDGDIASNNHGWQWVAGTGTDASPYYRVFNPMTQGKKFDPNGDYVLHYVPELQGVPAKFIHEPWNAPNGIPMGYVEPIVDHAEEREEALARYNAVR